MADNKDVTRLISLLLPSVSACLANRSSTTPEHWSFLQMNQYPSQSLPLARRVTTLSPTECARFVGSRCFNTRCQKLSRSSPPPRALQDRTRPTSRLLPSPLVPIHRMQSGLPTPTSGLDLQSKKSLPPLPESCRARVSWFR